MTDKLTPQQRHRNMAAIHGKDTKPEMVVRRFLWGRGFRYRLNHPRLPGKPDIVLRKYRTCIFVNGCFWHGHDVEIYDLGIYNLQFKGSGIDDLQIDDSRITIENSACCRIPKTNRAFWVKKIMRNQERDKQVQQQLALMGWHSITVWECQLKPKVRQQTLESLEYTLNSIYLQNHSLHRYAMPEEEKQMAAESNCSRNERRDT